MTSASAVTGWSLAAAAAIATLGGDMQQTPNPPSPIPAEDIMGEPLQDVPDASPEDVAFFREYAGMTDEEKDRYRQALQIMFPDKGKSGD